MMTIKNEPAMPETRPMASKIPPGALSDTMLSCDSAKAMTATRPVTAIRLRARGNHTMGAGPLRCRSRREERGVRRFDEAIGGDPAKRTEFRGAVRGGAAGKERGGPLGTAHKIVNKTKSSPRTRLSSFQNFYEPTSKSRLTFTLNPLNSLTFSSSPIDSHSGLVQRDLIRSDKTHFEVVHLLTVQYC